MNIFFAIAALSATSASAFDAITGKYGVVDTNRAPKFFEPPKARKPGYTYGDEIKIGVAAEMDSMGMELKGTFDATGDTEMHVTNQSGGSVKIEIAIQNVVAELASPLMSFQCDSKDQIGSDENCAELFAVVGQEETLLLDKDGNLLEMTTPDGETYNVAAMEQQTLQAQFQANQLAASQHFDKSQQFLELIPDHAVRPGDTWIDDIAFDEYGNFKGTSQLKGYTTYQGSDCALFRFDGTLHLDVSIVASAIGLDPEQLPSNLQDTVVTNEILYDVNDDLIRWVEVNLTTSFDLPNPMDPNGESTAYIPVEVSLSLATDILARPTPEEEAAQQELAGGSESESSTYESTYKSTSSYDDVAAPEKTSSGGGGGGGASKGIFFALLVGFAAAGGFMLYKKRQEGWEFVRPSYEFSPVGAEPIYTSPPLV